MKRRLALVGLVWTLSCPAWATDAGWGLTPRKLEAFGGAHATDYSTVRSEHPIVSGVEGSLLASTPTPLRLQLDALAGAFSADAWMWAVAPRIFVPWSTGLVGLSYTLTNLPPTLVGHRLALDTRFDEATWFSVSTCLGYEVLNPGEDLFFGELFVHVFPADRWMITSGFSYAHAKIKQTRADIVVRAEYTAWLGDASAVALYVNYGGNLLTKASLGLTFYFDALPTAERARNRGVFFSRLR